MKVIKFILIFIVFMAFIGIFSTMQLGSIKNQVADDMVRQYNLSVRGGDKIEICVHAGLVTAAYNQAHNDSEYLKWKQIEKSDCRSAGIPK